MMENGRQFYRRIESRDLAAQSLDAWYSSAMTDQMWDDFLRAAPSGQFQQSSLWAEYKAGDGWSHHRVVLTSDSGIVGGFQILWKATRFGRIGYVSKGPVSYPETADRVRLLELLLVQASKLIGLIALIAQQPDDSGYEFGVWGKSLFFRSNPMGVIESTYLVDLSEGMGRVRSRMHRKVRQYVRKAHQSGVVVRPGAESDISVFFELMKATCRRHGTKPNPASVEAVRRLWTIFSRSQSVEMALVECGGSVVAGRLSLVFGDRVTLWKKGWNGSYAHWHPNELMLDDSLAWAQARGVRVADFCAINYRLAKELVGGQCLDPAEICSNDAFICRFGGYPKLLPRAQLLLPQSTLRWSYRNTYALFESLTGP
jgi:lipid II:glycine glycyltransferase (peptidoglycan interpeptide bridge formation enzyme)